jgi:hypothetical protein
MSTTKYLDHTIFDIYTKESCYWAGFLAADGCIDINGTISFELKEEDSNSITDFKSFCKATHDITYNSKTRASRIRFVSRKIADDLKYNFSVGIDKTHNLEVPLLSELWQYAAYYRGFFDGDGCFSEFFNNRPTASYRVFLTSGSLVFLEETLLLLRSYSVIRGGSIQKKAANCWHIQLAIKDSDTFLKWIYSIEGPYLVRKYNKYNSIIVQGNRAKWKV